MSLTPEQKRINFGDPRLAGPEADLRKATNYDAEILRRFLANEPLPKDAKARARKLIREIKASKLER